MTFSSFQGYITGGPVKCDDPCYIIRKKEKKIFQAIQNQNFVSIVGPRQIGKTSLLHKIQSICMKDYGYACISIDLSTINNPDYDWRTWVEIFCKKIIQQVRNLIETEILLRPPVSPSDFVDYCIDLTKIVPSPQILFLLDEAASVPENIRDMFYGNIRSIRNEKVKPDHDIALEKINFVFAGVFDPERLVRDRINSPFNVSQVHYLPDFTFDESVTLGNNLHTKDDLPLDEEVLRFIYKWTSGQPYLTQCIFSLIADELENEGPVNEFTLLKLIPNLLEMASGNINPVVKSSVMFPETLNVIKRLLAGDKIPFSRAREEIGQLELFGSIAEGENRICKIRNKVYEKVFMETLEYSMDSILSQEGKNTMGYYNNGYALIVGVGTNLPATVSDAKALNELLLDPQRCGYPKDQVKLLTESEATRENILDGLSWLTEQAAKNPNANVIVYFSGHGGKTPQYHLLPFGYDPNDQQNTAISGIEFTGKLHAIKTKKLLVLLDCCHAGGMADLKGEGFEKSPIPPEFDKIFTIGSGRAVIASSRKDEVSYAGNPYSRFTQALLEGLAGYGAADQDGYAYLTDIALYVGRMVPNRTGDKQHPILKIAGADNFAIAYYAGGEKKPKSLNIFDETPVIQPVEFEEEFITRKRAIIKTYNKNLLDIEEQMAAFIDQRSIPLDLIRTKEGIIRKILELETDYKNKIIDKKTQNQPTSFQKVKSEALIKRIELLQSEYLAVSQQKDITLDPSASVKLEKKLDLLQSEITKLELEIKDILE